jgi:hypothetical protein
MRWDNLFDDLESQLEREITAEEIDLKAEEERLRLARLGIRDRILAIHDAGLPEGERMLRLVLSDGSRIRVVPVAFGRDWFSGELVDDSGRKPGCIVPLDAVAGIILSRGQIAPSLTGTPADESSATLSARLGLGFVLRDLCRRRRPLDLHLAGAVLHGTLDRVGRDHCDLALHEAGGVRREASVTEFRVVRMSQLLLVKL